jgi:N-acetylmuramoyl-L-alanine amidase
MTPPPPRPNPATSPRTTRCTGLGWLRLAAVGLALATSSGPCLGQMTPSPALRAVPANAPEPPSAEPSPAATTSPATATSPAASRSGSHPLSALPIRTDRERNLARWKPAITAYSKRHYGEATAALKPVCIVLHFTAGSGFPTNLVESSSFAGEAPGLASHYVVDGSTIWQILPPTVRSRGAYGINHRGINIEMVARDARDLSHRTRTLATCAKLVAALQHEFGIDTHKIYSHSAVSRMQRSLVPEVYDRVDSRPYGKPDPGDANMRAILKLLRAP